MYKIVDEKLGIASCGIADLTMQQVDSFLKGWGDGAKIGQLTLFRDNQNRVVLNADNPNYEFYLDLVQTYLCAEECNRKEFAEKVPAGMKETIAVLDDTIELRQVASEMKILGNHVIDTSLFSSLMMDAIVKRFGGDGSVVMPVYMGFVYGRMQGKREERARRYRRE